MGFQALFFVRYLIHLTEGKYDPASRSSPLNIKSPVLLSSEPKFDRELSDAMKLSEGQESPAQILLSKNPSHSSNLQTIDVIKLLQESALPDGRTAPEIMSIAAIKLAPGCEFVPLSELLDVVQRRAELEIQYPSIQLTFTAPRDDIDYLARRIRLDLNRQIEMPLPTRGFKL